MNLFGRESRSQDNEQIETIIGPTANLRGTLRSDGGIRIDGAFEGVIECAGNLIVAQGAKVIADVTARNVVVGGAVKGNVDATGRLEILSTGVVYGDMSVAEVMIDQGGQFHGMSRMRGLDHPALAPPEDYEPADKDAADGNGVVDIRLEDEPVEVTARASEDDEAIEATARTSEEDDVFDLDLDDLDLDMDIEPVIPEADEKTEKQSSGRRSRS